MEGNLVQGPAGLLKSLRKLMRPLVRLLLRSGVTFPILAELLRELYVDVAASDVIQTAKGLTDSRISVITGIHRKEVKRLRNQATSSDTTPGIVTLSSALISRWLGTDAFTDAAGAPLPLPRNAQVGAPSFEALVQMLTSDVRPRTVLDDWLSQNIVTVADDGLIRLNTSAFVPKPGRDEQLYYFSRNLHDHIAAAADNVTASGQAPFLDRSAHYDRLSAAVAKKLQAIGRDEAQRLLVDINRQALKMVDEDEASVVQEPGSSTFRVNLGVYLYVEDGPST